MSESSSPAAGSGAARPLGPRPAARAPFRAIFGAMALVGSTLSLPAFATPPARTTSLLQLGLFQKEGEAWWAWQSMQRGQPDLVQGLTPRIVPLDARKQGGGVALRATAPAGMNVQTLCRRMVGAGFGCLVLEEAAEPKSGTPVPDAGPDAGPMASPATPPVAKPTVTPTATALPAPPAPEPSKTAPSETLSYTEDEARTMNDIERAGRRKGRLGAVIPDTPYDVMPATLKRENWNLCALTFDDGPHRVVTRQILDVLNREKIRATYFPVAKVAASQGDVIRDFIAAGHEIGNHSLTHSDLRVLSAESQRFEIAEANRILRDLGANPVLFRPPYGRYTLEMLAVAREERMSPVLWTVDTRDWQVRDPDKIVQHVKTAAGTGSVLLLHSTYPSTLNALPRVIGEMRAKGCEFVTLSEWIERMRQLAMPHMVNASEPVVSADAPARAVQN